MRLPRFASGAAIIPGTTIAKVVPAVAYAGAPAGVVWVKHCSGTPPGQANTGIAAVLLEGIENATASVGLSGLRPDHLAKFAICKSVRGALMSLGWGR